MILPQTKKNNKKAHFMFSFYSFVFPYFYSFSSYAMVSFQSNKKIFPPPRLSSSSSFISLKFFFSTLKTNNEEEWKVKNGLKNWTVPIRTDRVYIGSI